MSMAIEITIKTPELADAILALAAIFKHRQTPPTSNATAPAAASPVPTVPQAVSSPAQVNPPAPQATVPAPAQSPVTFAPPPPPSAASAAPAYTLEQISMAGAGLADAGKTADLINLLAQFGTNTVKGLKPEQYGAFATALRGMGAAI